MYIDLTVDPHGRSLSELDKSDPMRWHLVECPWAELPDLENDVPSSII
jgi:hypothetical protein